MTAIQEVMQNQITRALLRKEQAKSRKQSDAKIAENQKLTDIRRTIEERIEFKLLGAA